MSAPDSSTSTQTPWQRRQAAAAKYGRSRRHIAVIAIDDRRLPNEHEIRVYRDTEAAFEEAHLAWLASRAAKIAEE